MVNKGVILSFKIEERDNLKYQIKIKLDLNIDMKGKKYNVFISNLDTLNPTPNILEMENYYNIDFNPCYFIGKKCYFDIDIKNKKIISLEWTNEID